VKAVVMAGGEGTRLRPLTSNQPKPMVPIVGKPCMEHIIELLREHGMTEVIVTGRVPAAGDPRVLRNGDSLGVEIEYSVEESPLGTAGSVRLASEQAGRTFLVISGDALCDVDLTKLAEFHREQGAAVTIGLKSVDNPLEFGIVVTDEDGRVERFLEKPSWGQVFSDTINTGIYVIEPEVLRHIPTTAVRLLQGALPAPARDGPADLRLRDGRLLAGHRNLDQYRQANFDALDEKVRLNLPGIRLRGNIWIGDGVEIDDLDGVSGPAFVGNYCRISPEAVVDPYTVLGRARRCASACGPRGR
jgi:mannose-1-phosphate guanylyltransferase/phosphomannomutase